MVLCRRERSLLCCGCLRGEGGDWVCGCLCVGACTDMEGVCASVLVDVLVLVGRGVCVYSWQAAQLCIVFIICM